MPRFNIFVIEIALLGGLLFPWEGRAETALELAVPKEVHVTTLVVLNDQISRPLPSNVAFDVDPDGLPVIAEGSYLKILSVPGQQQVQGVSTIDDIAWRDGSLMLVAQDHLATLGPSGVVWGLELPGRGMRIRPAGNGTAYVFGGSAEPASNSVYLVARDGTVTKLVTMPVPVTAVAGDGRTTYIAAGTTLFRFSFGEPLEALLEAGAPIVSLEIAPERGLFYSTVSAVGYIMSDGTAYEFLHGQGGLLRIRGSTLFLLIPGESNLVRFGSIERFESVAPMAAGIKARRPSGEYVEELREIKRTSDVLNHANLDTCTEFWIERNTIFKTRSYCFHTSRAIDYFGNDGCTYRDQNEVPLTRQDHARVADIIAQERPLGCIGQATAAPPGSATQATCADLWVARNAIYKARGYCFSTPRAISHFGNAGCTYRNQGAVPLTREERARVRNIQSQERSLGCN